MVTPVLYVQHYNAIVPHGNTCSLCPTLQCTWTSCNTCSPCLMLTGARWPRECCSGARHPPKSPSVRPSGSWRRWSWCPPRRTMMMARRTPARTREWNKPDAQKVKHGQDFKIIWFLLLLLLLLISAGKLSLSSQGNIQTHKRFERTLFIRTKHYRQIFYLTDHFYIALFSALEQTERIFKVLHLSSCETTLKQQLNHEKWWKMRWRAKPLNSWLLGQESLSWNHETMELL